MSQLTTEQLLLLIDEAEGPQSVALGGTDLSGIDLSGAHLQRLMSGMGLDGPVWFARSMDLRGWVRANGVNLPGAQLDGANPSGSDLSGANLEGAVLVDADLTGANLEGARGLGA